MLDFGLNGKSQNSRQVPGLYPLKRGYDKGQFIFVKPGFNPTENLTPAPELNPENNPYRGLNSFEERQANFFFGREKLIDELRDRLVNSPNNFPLIAVLGVSGSGKSSLVKAGLVPKLREQSEKEKWYILEPMRPGLLPFAELAKVFLPIINPELLTDLNQVSFLDEKMKAILDSKSGINKDLGNGTSARANNSEQSLEQKNIDIKLAKKWCSATDKAKLLLILDYYEKLKNFFQGSSEKQESEKLSALHQKITEALGKEKIVESVKSHTGTKILLVIDQFEELITLAQSDSKTNQLGSDLELSTGQQFLEFLKVILQECSKNLRVIVTLRSDFEPRFINSPLEDYWNDARFPVRAMNSDELREAIAGPAEKQALNFQPDELVGQLVDEVGQMPGALPLLSFTLSELYIKLYERNRAGGLERALQGEDYKALGGVAGALTRRATEEYDNLLTDFGEDSGKAYQATMRRVMLRMVSLEGGAIARRRVLDSELIYADVAENERVNTIKDRLVSARLLVKGQENGVSYVEPAHDFLVRGWDRLQEWIRGEQENLSLQQRLTLAAMEWQDQKEKESSQSIGVQRKVEPVINWVDRGLFTVENLVNQVPLKLGSIVRRSQNQQGQTREKSVQFLWDSNPYLKVLDQELESDQHWLNAVETEFVKESVLQKRRGVSWRWRIAIAVMLGLSGLTLFAFNQRKTAIAREIAAQSQLTREQQISNLQQSTLLAVEAMRRFPSLEADQALRSSLNLLPRPIANINHIDSINKVVFSPNGKYLASASSDKTIKISEVDTGKQIFSFRHNEEVNAITFSPNGKYLASASGDNTAKIWNLENGQEVLKFPHDDDVLNVTFSPDGQYLAIENRESTKLWKIENKEQIFKFKGNINQVIFSPNGRYLAVAIDNMAKILDISQRQIVKSLKHKSEDSVTSIAFSPDGRYFATASRDGQQIDDSSSSLGVGGTAKLWNFTTDKEIASIKHKAEITNIAFSPNGQYIATTSGTGGSFLRDKDFTTRVFEIDKNEVGISVSREVASIPNETVIQTINFSPDSQYIAIANREAQVWELANGKEVVRLLSLNEERINTITFSPNGKYLAAGGSNGIAQIFDFTQVGGFSFLEKENKENLNADSFTVNFNRNLLDAKYKSLMISPNTQYLILVKDDNKLVILDTSYGKKLYSIDNDIVVNNIRFTSNSKYFVVSGQEGSKVLETENGKLLIKLPAKELFKDLSPNSQFIAVEETNVEETNNTIYIFDVINKRKLIDLGRSNDVSAIAFSPDNKHIVVLKNDPKKYKDTDPNRRFWIVEIWKIEQNSKIVKQYQAVQSSDSPDDVLQDSIVFSPNGELFFTILPSSGDIRAWNTSTGKFIASLPLKKDENLLSFDFSADGKHLATVTMSDNTLRLWEIPNFKEITPMRKQFDKPIQAVSFSSNGHYLATGGEDNTARIWEFSSGQETLRLKHDSVVFGVNFSPDGKSLFTYSTDSVMQGWILSQEILIADACNRLNRNFTQDEWKRYFGENTILEPYQKTCPNLE